MTTDMKKWMAALALMLTLSAGTLSAKTLVLYYSFTNNVHTIVSNLQALTEVDVLRVEPAEEGLDYAANGYAIGSRLIAAIRQAPNDPASYPAIKPTNVNPADYDLIIVAAPLWWSNMAAPMQTFLFNYGSQMAGKNIALIVSSSSSGISSVVADAKRLIPDGKFLEPNLWIRSSQTSNSRALLSAWLEDIDYEHTSTAIAAAPVATADVSLTQAQGRLSVNGRFTSLSLFNAAGAKVLHTTNGDVATTSLTPGTYVAAVSTAEGVKTFKVSVAR